MPHVSEIRLWVTQPLRQLPENKKADDVEPSRESWLKQFSKNLQQRQASAQTGVSVSENCPLKRLTGGGKLAWSYNLLQTGEGPIEVVSRADQRQMGECLGKIPEMFTARTEFLRIKTEVIGVTDRLFEKEACLL